MAVTFCSGFEAQVPNNVDGIGSLVGTCTYDTTTVRSVGGTSLRVNPASAATGYLLLTPGPTVLNRWVHFGLRIATLPSVERLIFGRLFAAMINLRLTSAGNLAVYQNTTLVGTSSTALSTGTWYWVGVRVVDGTSAVFLQIDGVNEVTGTATSIAEGSSVLGCSGSEASAIDIYFDDFIWDDAGFLASSYVVRLKPTADSARSAGWVGGAGGTTNLWDAVDNAPPVGVVDPGTNTSQIRNATAEANGSYDATLTTYTAAGIGASDTILAVQPYVLTAAPVTTSSKQGTVGVVSNPTIANVALGPGGTAGAFWGGATAGTYTVTAAAGWKGSPGTFTASPSVTLGTAPVMRITQVTSSTRIAMVCAMGMYVAYTPGVAVTRVPYINPMPALIAQ